MCDQTYIDRRVLSTLRTSFLDHCLFISCGRCLTVLFFFNRELNRFPPISFGPTRFPIIPVYWGQRVAQANFWTTYSALLLGLLFYFTVVQSACMLTRLVTVSYFLWGLDILLSLILSGMRDNTTVLTLVFLLPCQFNFKARQQVYLLLMVSHFCLVTSMEFCVFYPALFLQYRNSLQ